MKSQIGMEPGGSKGSFGTQAGEVKTILAIASSLKVEEGLREIAELNGLRIS